MRKAPDVIDWVSEMKAKGEPFALATVVRTVAATAVKDYLQANGIQGRVRYYGCPAEEGGAAKGFMARAGAFSDVDVAISWHPSSFSGVNPAISLANTRIDFSFHGRASHAAASPHLGRSALDAVELMSVGVNYMREHMPSDARVHSAILDAGGVAPNVVQAFAKVRYLIRAATLPELSSLIARVRKIADGAALMTETKVTAQVVSAVSNLLANTPLERAMQDNLDRLGPPPFDEADRGAAAEFQATLTDEDIEASYRRAGIPGKLDTPLCDEILPVDAKPNGGVGSTDVGDVSWVVPTVQVHAPTVAIGTPFHTWQVVAQGKTPAAHKAMVQAAKAMAGLGVKALVEPDLIAAAKADLSKRTARTPYVCPLPDNIALDFTRASCNRHRTRSEHPITPFSTIERKRGVLLDLAVGTK